ncbi:unnamed protein product [Schistosoma mattheei]|uniref:Uncharacterized protein n=1 Tax=Schistosoma mattheei TaxID=31246 RepID=A0A183P3T3_9TREM|nr:unnamed protein product [Schistosoma mattheei]
MKHRLQCLGHVLRMSSQRIPRRGLFADSGTGRRKRRGGQYMTWCRDMKESCKKLASVGLSQLPGWGPKDGATHENNDYNYEPFKHLQYPTVMKDIEDECEKCDRKKCPPIIQCNVGTVRDKCGCCDICALEEAQLCNIPEDFKNGILKPGITWHGMCGTDLECRTRTDIDSKIIGSQSICYCVKPGKVCGSDGVTYSKCKMNATIISSNGTVIPISEGPCQTGKLLFLKVYR